MTFPALHTSITTLSESSTSEVTQSGADIAGMIAGAFCGLFCLTGMALIIVLLQKKRRKQISEKAQSQVVDKPEPPAGSVTTDVTEHFQTAGSLSVLPSRNSLLREAPPVYTYRTDWDPDSEHYELAIRRLHTLEEATPTEHFERPRYARSV